MKIQEENKKFKVFFWAGSVWTGWVLFYAFIMYLQVSDISFISALISSANMNYIFAFLSIIIWYICKNFNFEKTPKVLFITVQFMLAIFFSALWLFLFYGFWYLAQGKIIFELVGFRNIIGWQFLNGMTIYFLICGTFYSIIYYRSYKQKELAEAELKMLTREAELKALKLQINPHFLFNSLNSINALITKDSSLARKMIASLSELLRVSLENHDKLMIPLKEELDLVHKYLAIEQIRFQDKMQYQEDVEPSLLTHSFPAMMLQPLLENAVKHGVANSRSGGFINLSIKENNSRMQISIVNQIEDHIHIQPHANSRSGTGLINVRQRLDRLYGQNYSWEIDRTKPGMFEIRIELHLTR